MKMPAHESLDTCRFTSSSQPLSMFSARDLVSIVCHFRSLNISAIFRKSQQSLPASYCAQNLLHLFYLTLPGFCLCRLLIRRYLHLTACSSVPENAHAFLTTCILHASLPSWRLDSGWLAKAKSIDAART